MYSIANFTPLGKGNFVGFFREIKIFPAGGVFTQHPGTRRIYWKNPEKL